MAELQTFTPGNNVDFIHANVRWNGGTLDQSAGEEAKETSQQFAQLLLTLVFAAAHRFHDLC